MNNNSLIPIKENIFKKVFNFFKRLFFKKENLIIQPEENIDDSNDLFKQFAKVGYIYEEHNFINDINPEEDKKEFFELYEKVKNKVISIEALSGINLIRINQIIKKEVNIKQNKLN